MIVTLESNEEIAVVREGIVRLGSMYGERIERAKTNGVSMIEIQPLIDRRAVALAVLTQIDERLQDTPIPASVQE